MSQGRYAGKTAIVTGGASGIGLNLSKRLAAQGCHVVIADVNRPAGEAAAQELNAAYPESDVQFHGADVSSFPSVQALFSAAVALSPNQRIDFVFANAGISQLRSFSEPITAHPTMFANVGLLPSTSLSTPPDLSVVHVNLLGVLHCIYAALAQFRLQPPDEHGWRGKIVATASNASLYPFPADVLYAASKAGVWGAVRSLAPRVAGEGITVNCLAPSVVESALGPPGFNDRLAKENRVLSHDTIFEAVELFIKPESHLTGQICENAPPAENVLRLPHAYVSDGARENMNEFWSMEEMERIVATGEARSAP